MVSLRSSNPERRMSIEGHFQPRQRHLASRLMSAAGLIAAVRSTDVRRSVPKAAVSNRSKTVFLLDDLVGGHLHDQRHREAECLRRFEIDDEFELGRLHHGKLGGLLTLEDAIDIEGRLAELVF
jgi:hypothetical protein